jgi:superfamily II DNA or RNA helicase
MAFKLDITPQGVILQMQHEQAGLLRKLWQRKVQSSLSELVIADRDLTLAIADLRAMEDQWPGEVRIGEREINLSHRVTAALGGRVAEVLNLPPTVDLTLRTDAQGLLGSRNFKLRYEWFRQGQRQFPVRTGAILQTGDGPRRLPLWMMEALDVADHLQATGSDVDHWAALARFRNALEPGVQMAASSQAARVSLTDFLSGLSVRVADQFSIVPNQAADDFEVLPFSSSTIESADIGPGEEVSNQNAELSGNNLRAFQIRVRERGALPAFRLAPQSFLVIDRDAAPALDIMAQMQQAPADERTAFIRNPRPRITEAYDAHLRATGKLEGLTAEAEEQAIEAAAVPAFIETREFSERVKGISVFQKKILDSLSDGSTTWLPEVFVERLSAALSGMSKSDLEELRSKTEEAIRDREPTIIVGDLAVPARPEFVKLLDDWIDPNRAGEPADAETSPKGPLVLDTFDNFEDTRWTAKLRPRNSFVEPRLSSVIRTQLKAHQKDSFDWQVRAWKAGLPGILNADEQGLGKTLQTIAFLCWLKENTAQPGCISRGPILVVAPTSLLENWEQEVRQHVEEPGLGHLIRLYGSAIGARRLTGTTGRDIDSAEAKLDFRTIKEALEEGRAHRHWFLTTYTTLTNYQHSLARIPFAAAVFDEIQAIKNPDSLRASAARAVNADFRIGLTGTPIENSAVDLWAIMDQLVPGSLGSLKEFRAGYSSPDEKNMQQLHTRVFKPVGSCPPLAIRRIKDDVARDLPSKTRRLHPRLMPEHQATVYEDARLKLARGGLGAALKMLHHIRSVSVHPSLQDSSDDANYIEASGRLSAVFDILRKIKAKGERGLVFIEHRQMQFRFIELVKAEFGLKSVDLINGDTPIPQRQAIVNRFQRHLKQDGGFDLLVLGPKAAGTGLTLTAATHVIHLSRWWNPAVEEQCNDRVHRIGQVKPVTVHVPMAIHTGYRENSFDCLLHSLMQRKRRLSASVLWPMGDSDADVAELQKMLACDSHSSEGEPLTSSIEAMFRRDELPLPPFEADGSVSYY